MKDGRVFQAPGKTRTLRALSLTTLTIKPLQMQIQLEMRERQLQELDDPDHVDELTDQECIDNIVKTLSSNGL